MSLTDTIRILTAKLNDDPADDANRLILADALQEAGDEAAAAFVREAPCTCEDGEFVRYTLDMGSPCGSWLEREFAARPTDEECNEATIEYIEDGEWGDDGAELDGRWTLRRITADDAEGEEVEEAGVSVTIEPNHAQLIRDAAGSGNGCGTDPDDHDWQDAEYPWSGGGTTLIYRSHCRQCGLRRRETNYGAEVMSCERRCPVSYEMPDSWCAECQSEECGCEQDDE